MSMLDLTRPIDLTALRGYASRIGVPQSQIAALGAIELARVTMQRKLDNMKQYGPEFKGTRPWDLQPIRPLNEQEVWIGIEYETGFRSMEERNAAYDFAWAAFDGVTIDGEGVGNHYGEFTFSPVTLSTFADNQSDMDNFMRWRERVGSRHPLRASTIGSGIHLNVSTPLLRETPAGYQRDAMLAFGVAALTSILRDLSQAECSRLFGRAYPYGYAFNVGAHIEFKLFKTVDKLSEWMEYKPVMMKLVDAVIAVTETINHEFNSAPAECTSDYMRYNHLRDISFINTFREPLLAYLRGEISQEQFAVTGGRTKAALAAAAPTRRTRTRTRKAA